ncbi:MAG: tRNA(Met) cytidine acetyltransferase [Oleiphilaceae bacterium]|nr:tRNA(Met) cytidine acetyltransferase [Oleiphilaceae bacterium]
MSDGAGAGEGTEDRAEAWQRLQATLRTAGQRRLVLVEGERSDCLIWLRKILPVLTCETGLWTGPPEDLPRPDLTLVKPNAGRNWLGREIDLLAWDGWQGNPPDSLAALTGTLAAGGLWFWLMPPLADWPTFADPDYVRTGLEGAPTHPFAERMARVIAADPNSIRVRPGTPTDLPDLSAVEGPAFQPGGTADQARAVEAVVRTGHGRRRRPLVITADRGRGKSAALGLAAVACLRRARQGGQQAQIVVTAPSPRSVRTLFEHARDAAGSDGVATDDLYSLTLTNGQSLRFYAIDELLRESPPAALVMVDEAAAIPAPLLKRVLLGWPRVVYSTTTHGYEGSGRGFALRFRQVLNKYTPNWHAIELTEPVRWAPDDPLEALVQRLFLLDAESPGDAGSEPVTFGPWQPAKAPEAELAAAFGLLVDAHYRTTPGDLRQWLDDPGAGTWLAKARDRIVGVLWLTREGGLSAQLAQQVMAGKRRLRGHLLPQSLANHSGFAEAASLRLARVVRVAVHESCRRAGVGRHLVAVASKHASAEGLDGLGSSFGASPDLLVFWRDCGLDVMRLGLRREASSGEYAMQMLVGLSPKGRAMADEIRSRFGAHWLMMLPRLWPALSSDLTLTLTEQLAPGLEFGLADRRELQAFCHGYRGFELSLPALLRLSGRAEAIARLQGLENRRLWCRAVLQGWSWRELQAAGDCGGREDGESRLRCLAIIAAGPELTARLTDRPDRSRPA